MTGENGCDCGVNGCKNGVSKSGSLAGGTEEAGFSTGTRTAPEKRIEPKRYATPLLYGLPDSNIWWGCLQEVSSAPIQDIFPRPYIRLFSTKMALAWKPLLLLALAVCGQPFVAFDRSGLSPGSFLDQFSYSSIEESSWTVSHAKRDDEYSYDGEWAVEPAYKYPGFEDDSGLVVKTVAAHHAVSRKLPEAFSNENDHLVLQYEVKLQEGISCGGAYIKLLSGDYDPAQFGLSTPFKVLFGPDVCGANNKIDLVLHVKNPRTGEYERRDLKNPPMARTNQLLNLYTLVLSKEQTVEIRIDGEVALFASLYDEGLFSPPLNPEKTIPDSKDRKPAFWDDREYVADPKSVKPDDYDAKYASPTIPDESAVKPADWDDTVPEYIEDPNATRPEHWNDEIDGIWLAPEIVNPLCYSTGCGVWKPPQLPNADYIGPWTQEVVENPNYMGEWKPRNIPNPDYFEVVNPSFIGPVTGLGFELWTMDSGILFDNIYLGHSVGEAELIGNTTYERKLALEFEDYQINRPKPLHAPRLPPRLFDELIYDDDESTLTQFVEFLKLVAWKQYLNFKDFYYEARTDPVTLVLNEPFKVLVYSILFLVAFAFVFGVSNVLVFVVGGPASASYNESHGDSETPKIEEIFDVSDDEAVATGRAGRETAPRKR